MTTTNWQLVVIAAILAVLTTTPWRCTYRHNELMRVECAQLPPYEQSLLEECR